jgi:hypothetical protein
MRACSSFRRLRSLFSGEQWASAPVDPREESAVNYMAVDDRKRTLLKDLVLAALMVAAGLAISGMALTELRAAHTAELAQATQPLQSSPPADQDKTPPAESKPGGERPTTPAPEPAHPDDQAQKEGAKPMLPQAPAEKMAPPIQQK